MTKNSVKSHKLSSKTKSNLLKQFNDNYIFFNDYIFVKKNEKDRNLLANSNIKIIKYYKVINFLTFVKWTN